MTVLQKKTDNPIAHLTDDFDHLRWFELPAGTLVEEVE